MKFGKLLFTLVCLFAISLSLNANVYLKYYNKDAKKWTFEVKIGGSTKKVEFGASKTSSVTIQGAYEEAEIETECGWVTVHDDDRIEIKDGCITIK